MPETEWGWEISPQELKEWIQEDSEEHTLINKPALVVCHPSKHGPWSSVAGAYKEHLGHPKAHLISRLDRETSGIILFAKKPRISRIYQMALQKRKVAKSYLAILEGKLDSEMLVETGIGRDKRSEVYSKNCTKTDGHSKEAQTHIHPLQSKNGYTLAHIRPHTGRKHQIRVHAQHIGHSIIGDKLYGPDEKLFLDFIENGWNERLAAKLPLDRQALHAYRMEFDLEEGKKSFIAPLAEDLISFCESRMDLKRIEIDKLLEKI